MNKRYSYLLVAILLPASLLFSCKKDEKGCKDPNAINFNTNADTDDGSCRYLADAYVGNYIAKDTISYLNTNTGLTVTETRQLNLTFTKAAHNKVVISGIPYCNTTVEAMVTATQLTLIDGSAQCGIDGFISNFNGTRLKYSYTWGDAVSSRFVEGEAIKQP